MFETCRGEGNDSCSPDDSQPRHNIKKMFDEGTLKLDNEKAILFFTNKLIVEKKSVKGHLLYVTTLEPLCKGQIRKTATETTKTVQGIQLGHSMTPTGEIQQLTGRELEKYLIHFKLSLKGKENDKIRRIITHASNKQGEEINAYFSRQHP